MRIPLLMAVLVIIISVCLDLYIYLRLRRANPGRGNISRGYGIFAVVGWIFIAICLLLPRRDGTHGILFQMWGIYAYLTLLIPKLIYAIFTLIDLIPRIFRHHGWHTARYAGFPLALIVFAAMWWGALVTRHQIEVTHTDIYSARLPEAFDGYRIIQISDLHVGTWGSDTRFISNLVDSVNSYDPDLILFTGDIVNRETSELAPFLSTLSRLRAKDGIYSVLGNHDYGDYVDWPSPAEKAENLQLLKNWQRQIGWNLLNNSRTELIQGIDTIRLIGVENWGEPPFRQYGHLVDAYPANRDSLFHLNDNRFKILMTHNPEHWRREVTKISNIDLTLSGHTHAMQTELRLGNLHWSPSVWKYPQWGGLYKKDSKDGTPMQIYVNIGAGEVGMPYRIGAIPEISLLTLRRLK